MKMHYSPIIKYPKETLEKIVSNFGEEYRQCEEIMENLHNEYVTSNAVERRKIKERVFKCVYGEILDKPVTLPPP